MPKIEQSQQMFQIHKEKYDQMRNDVSVKLKFLEENKVRKSITIIWGEIGGLNRRYLVTIAILSHRSCFLVPAASTF